MTGNYRSPPSFTGNFLQWEKEVKLWVRVSGVKAENAGGVIALSLTGIARTLATSIAEEDLIKPEGVTLVLAEVKKLYAKDNVDSKFKMLKEVEDFTRKPEQTVMEYLAQFERKYQEAADHLGEQPYGETMKAYKLLHGANLQDTDLKIVRSSLEDWKFDLVCTSLKRIFGSESCAFASSTSVPDNLIAIKEEMTYYHGQSSSGSMSDKVCFHCNKKGHIKRFCYKLKNKQKGNYYPNKYPEKKEKNWDKERNSDKCNDTHYLKEDTYGIFYALNHALLDCGASKTVVGEKWLEHYKNCLDKDNKIVVVDTTESVFRFGDTRSVSSVSKRIPLNIGDSTYHINTRVVKEDIPLLISLKTMKDMNMSIDFKNDLSTIQGQKVKLVHSDRGHYLIPLVIDQICIATVEKLPSADRIHRAFGHSSSDAIIRTLRTCNKSSEKIEADLKKIDAKCDFCAKHRRRTTNPSVSLLGTGEFNELICLDLKFIKEEGGRSTIVLHVIDHMTKFSAAKILKTKCGPEVVRGLMLAWIAIFGPPKTLLSDNGLEFCNKDMNELCEMLGIKHKTTASYAPFSNGLVERHNGLIDRMLKKIKADLKVDTELALCWAVNAKNSLANISGYSPYQLTFGKNPNIGDLSKEDPVLLDKTTSQVVGEILNSIQKSREAFMEVANSNKLKRALKAKVENSNCKHYKTQDDVVYRRSIDDSWLKGRAIGQIGTTVYIDKGGQIIKAHHTNVRLAEQTVRNTERSRDTACVAQVKPSKRVVEQPEAVVQDFYADSDFYFESDEDTELPGLEEIEQVHAEDQDVLAERVEENEDIRASVEENDEDNRASVEENEDNRASDEASSNDEPDEFASVDSNLSSKEDDKVEELSFWVDVYDKDFCQVTVRNKDDCMILKKGDIITYELDSETCLAKVINRSGKVTGELKNRFNVKLLDQQPSRVTLNAVDNLEKIVPVKVLVGIEESEIFIVVPDKDDTAIQLAKDQELENLKKFETFTEVREAGQESISSRWVIQEKSVGEKRIVKARLVCRGFEDPGDVVNKESPTVDKTSVRLFMAVSAMNKWEPRSFDIKSAFLQSNTLDREVFVKPPRDIKEQHLIWKLKKPLYGLSDSSRNWYITFKQDLLERGLVVSTFDKAVFIYKTDGKLQGILAVHVDDVLYSGTGKMRDILKNVAKKFELSRSEEGAMRYIGIDVNGRDPGAYDQMTLSQSSYTNVCNLLVGTISEKTRGLNKEDELTEELKTLYRSLVGKLNWLSCNTRPDIKFDVFRLSSCTSHTVEDLLSVRKTIKKLKIGPAFITFPKLVVSALEIIVYSDAALGNLDGGIHSCKAFIIFASDGQRCCPLNWSTKKIDRVCTNTLEAETRALLYGIKHGEAVRDNLCEVMGIEIPVIPISCIVDNMSLHKACYSENNVSDPTLRRVVAAIQQKITKGIVSKVVWMKSGDMLADALTKSERVDIAKLATILQNGRM